MSSVRQTSQPLHGPARGAHDRTQRSRHATASARRFDGARRAHLIGGLESRKSKAPAMRKSSRVGDASDLRRGPSARCVPRRSESGVPPVKLTVAARRDCGNCEAFQNVRAVRLPLPARYARVQSETCGLSASMIASRSLLGYRRTSSPPERLYRTFRVGKSALARTIRRRLNGSRDASQLSIPASVPDHMYR